MKVIIQKIILFYLLNIVILCIGEEKFLEKSGKAYQFYSDPYSNYHVLDYHNNNNNGNLEHLEQPLRNSNQILNLVPDNEEIIQREQKSITIKPKTKSIKKLIKVVKRIKSPTTSGKLLKKPVSLELLDSTNSEFHPVTHPVHNPLPPPVFEFVPQTPIPHVVPQLAPQALPQTPITNHLQSSGIHVTHHSTPLPIVIQPSTPFQFQNQIEFPRFSDGIPIVKSLPLRIRSNQTKQLVPLLLPTVNEIADNDNDQIIDLEELPRFPDVIKKIKPSFLSFEQAPPPISIPKIPHQKIQFNFDVKNKELPDLLPEIDANGGFKPSLTPATIPNYQYQTPEEQIPPSVSQNF